MTVLVRGLAGLGIVLAGAPVLRGQEAGTPQRPGPVAQNREEEQRGSHLWFIDGRVSGVFDSNVDHEAVPQASYGTVGRLALGIRSSRSRPLVSGWYDLGFYRFTNSEQWNRTTHDLGIELAPTLGPMRPRFSADIRVGSVTEDRELADQWALRPALEIRTSRSALITFYGTQRIRRITGRVERVDTSRYAGLELARRWNDGGRWELDGRYERYGSERPASRFVSWIARGMLRLPITKSNRAALQLTYRQRRYREDSVTTSGGEVPRFDRRWTPSLIATQDFAGGAWALELEYELESNRSNDPEKNFLAHRVGFTVRRRW